MGTVEGVKKELFWDWAKEYAHLPLRLEREQGMMSGIFDPSFFGCGPGSTSAEQPCRNAYMHRDTSSYYPTPLLRMSRDRNCGRNCPASTRRNLLLSDATLNRPCNSYRGAKLASCKREQWSIEFSP